MFAMRISGEAVHQALVLRLGCLGFVDAQGPSLQGGFELAYLMRHVSVLHGGVAKQSA